MRQAKGAAEGFYRDGQRPALQRSMKDHGQKEFAGAFFPAKTGLLELAQHFAVREIPRRREAIAQWGHHVAKRHYSNLS